MSKTKKILFAIPLLLILFFSAFLFAACGSDEEKTPIKVSTLSELNEAIKTTDDDHIIKLTKDISIEKDGDDIIPVLVYPETKDYDVVIDLNGYNIETNLRITNKQNNAAKDYKANLTVKNSKNTGGVIGSDQVYYGLVTRIDVDFNIKFENVKFKGIYGGAATNGTDKSNTVITAKNTSFVSTQTKTLTDPTDAGVGVYFASKNFTYNFENCYFEGYTGYHTKHGTHNLTNCTIKGLGTKAFDPAYYGNGCSATGSALVVESSSDYLQGSGEEAELVVNIKGGIFNSTSNYAIEEASTVKGEEAKICYAEITVTGNPVLKSATGKAAIESENNLIA